MSNKYLYLPIESKTRELDSKLLLAYYALKQNYSIILGSHTPIFSHLHLLPNGILCSKGYPFGDSRRGFMENAKALGYTLVELDEEGFLLNGPIYDRLGKDDKYIRLLDHVYCWGSSQKQVIARTFPGFKDRLHVTGHPRFDLLKDKFMSLYQSEIELIKQKYDNFILVNTRFTQYNHYQKGFIPSEHYLKKLYEAFIQLVKELSEKFPNRNIVVRPHIHENVNNYRKEFAGFPNIFVVHEGSIGKWLSAASVVIHNRCTTGIEAVLLDKPVIAYLPLKYEEEMKHLPNMVSSTAQDIPAIINFINSRNKLKTLAENKKILAEYYGAMDDNFAYKNIINFLNKINYTGENEIKASSIKALATVKSEAKMLSVDAIKLYFKRIDQLEKTTTNVNIRTLAPDLLEITSDI